MSEQLPKPKVAMHWLVAIGVIFLFVSSWWMLSLPLPSEDFTYRQLPFQMHKNVGITIMVMVVAMVALRIVKKRKQLQIKKSRLERLASLDHLLTYFHLLV